MSDSICTGSPIQSYNVNSDNSDYPCLLYALQEIDFNILLLSKTSAIRYFMDVCCCCVVENYYHEWILNSINPFSEVSDTIIDHALFCNKNYIKLFFKL
jgi:hypothetical protein